MKKTIHFLVFIAVALAIVLSVLLIYNLGVIYSVIGLIFGLIIYYLSKRSGWLKKIIQFTFIIVIVTTAITAYRSLFTTKDVKQPRVLEITRTIFEEENKVLIQKLNVESAPKSVFISNYCVVRKF